MSYGVSPQAVLRPSLYYLDRCHTLDATARNPHFPGKGDYHVNSFAGPVGGAAPIIADQAPMIDPFGRAVTYLRVSVTDRCDFRCTYCMAEKRTC
jgi:cyclic pyranopterin phosphate synthase